MRENLIIVRAGDCSLHPQWLNDPNRNWDLAVSYYGNNPHRYLDQYDYLHTYKGSKWQGIVDFINKNPNIAQNYKYIWLPDDDIFTNGQNISRFFKICENLNLTISQPALTSYSYYSWEITLNDLNAAARLTNFVEIMAPCFKAVHFGTFSKFFNENTSGWGYEWLWWKQAEEKGIAYFGIIDLTPVYHSRPVGTAGHGGSSTNPHEEFKLLMNKFKLEQFTPKVLKRLVYSKDNH